MALQSLRDLETFRYFILNQYRTTFEVLLIKQLRDRRKLGVVTFPNLPATLNEVILL